MTPLLPIGIGRAGGAKSFRVTDATTAREVLSLQVGSWYNGISILYAEVLGVKLNLANGAYGSAIAPTLTQVDNFLATRSHQDWNRLGLSDKLKVAVWAAQLASYNIGLKGPGLCR